MTNSVENNIKAFFQGTLIFTLASVLTKVAQVLLLPVITASITKEELGIADIIQAFYSFLLPILILGFDAAFGAFYFERGEDKEYKSRVFNTILAQMVASSAVALLLMAAAEPISTYLLGSPAYAVGIRVSLATVAVNLWIVPFSQFLRMEKRMKIFSFVTLIGSLVLLLSNFLLIVVARLGYFALVLAIFLSYAVQFVLFCLVVRPKLGFSQVDGKLYRQIARYALPFLPMLIVGWILSMSDRFLLTKMLPILEAQAQNGLYGVAARFQSILTMATSVIFTTFSAFAFSSRREEGAEQSFVFVHDTLHLFLVSAAFFASLFVQDIFRLLIDSSYNAAMASVAPLLFGQVCYASHTIFAYGFAFEKKSYLNLWPTLAGALLNIILNFIFIPKYGAAAAACTTFAGYALMMCVTYLMMRRVSPMPYRFWATEGSIAAAFFLSVLFWHASFSVRVGVFVLTLGGFAILYHSSLRAGLALLKRR